MIYCSALYFDTIDLAQHFDMQAADVIVPPQGYDFGVAIFLGERDIDLAPAPAVPFAVCIGFFRPRPRWVIHFYSLKPRP